MKVSFPLSFFAALSLLAISYFTGFFHLPKLEKRDSLTWANVIISFACYFFGMFIASLLGWLFPKSSFFDTLGLSLFGIIPLFFVLSYYQTLPSKFQKTIFWNLPIKTQKKIFISIKRSVANSLWSLIILLPLVTATGHMIQKIIYYLFSNINLKEQHVIKTFKKVSENFEYPGISILLITISFVIPFTEELLFRGFLQSRLRRYGRAFAIITTSLIFSGVHFSKEQADGNFILIPSLFVVSLFLGFLYEKEKNLVAPYLTHMLFNLSQALIITI